MLRSRPFVVMEYVTSPEPTIIEGEATVTETPAKPQPRKRQRVEPEASAEA